MISEKENIRLSKFLSLVLRHQPDLIGLKLGENGWADIEELIVKSKSKGFSLNKEILKYVVGTNTKKRFAFDENHEKIRASQGHSITVDLGYISSCPPEILYHGTSEKFVSSIQKTGIEKCSRQHVHLSPDIKTAVTVGKRHGKPFVFKVLALKMHENNCKFFLSENGVWLTDHVPTAFLETNNF